MAITWISKITINKDSIGSRELSQKDTDDILQVLEGEELLLKNITFQLFTSKLTPKLVNNGWFALEAWLVGRETTNEEVDNIIEFLDTALDIPKFDWDWINDNNDFSENYYYKLRVLRVLAIQYPSDTITKLLSYHVNPHVPWSNLLNSQVLDVKVNTTSDGFHKMLKPNLIKMDTKKKLQGGLNPRLGYGGAKTEILQEDVRNNWKKEHVKGISMVWFCMHKYDDWPVAVSFMLNLFDDYQAEFKIQALYLLQEFINHNPQALIKSGLKGEFKEAIKICLSYIPNLTPVDISKVILNLGYMAMIQLISIESNPLEYLDVINTNILSSLSHLTNRSNSDYPILRILVNQLTLIITHLKTAVLASFTRINFSLNQLITNPYIIDDVEGINLFQSCLECQSTVLDEFIQLKDKQGRELIGNYTHDFLGAWLVLLQRLDKADIENDNLTKCLVNNFSKLSQINPIETDIQTILEQTPSFKPAWERYIV